MATYTRSVPEWKRVLYNSGVLTSVEDRRNDAYVDGVVNVLKAIDAIPFRFATDFVSVDLSVELSDAQFAALHMTLRPEEV